MDKQELINKINKELNKITNEILFTRTNIMNLDITENELDCTSKLAYERGVFDTYNYILMLLMKL